MKRGSFAAGFLACLLLAGVTTTAYAAGIMAERSHHRIIVDGKEAQMEAYVINGNNYVKLRDIGEQVGFNVYWDSDNGCVQVESGKPYTGTAPQQTTAAPTDGSRYVPKVGDVIRCDDGTDYTIKDVSRWDKNAFSSAPLGELPTATCDWSKLPQPEMPQRATLPAADKTTCSNATSTKRGECSTPCIMPSGTTRKRGRTAHP